MMSWLQLLRLPTVFTALADVLCGFFIAAALISPVPPVWTALPWLLLSSAGLYLSGMVFNDVFDAALDSLERPERPIPSGRIGSRAATTAGAILMVSGIAAAVGAWSAVGQRGASPLVACCIAVAVLIYDRHLKSTNAAPLGMATCRFFNLLLGASTAVNTSQSIVCWQPPVVVMALALAVYIFGVTWFARNEAGDISVSGLMGGTATAAVGVIGAGIYTVGLQSDTTLRTIAAFQFAVVGMVTIVRAVRAIRAVHGADASPLLQRTVGKMLLWIIVLDAVCAFAVTGQWLQEAAILLLVVPAMTLRRWIAMS
jgi:hypothetical protein